MTDGEYMNSVIEGLTAHRSIRKYSSQQLSYDQLEALITAGQSAATSSFLQGVTVIRIKDGNKRKRIAELANNQAYIEEAPEFLVFCADLKRSSDCCLKHDQTPTTGFTEQFIIATVDTALVAQNVVVAAESMGLGICYIGAIRNNPRQVSELLKLPENVYPVFGLCLGYPAEDPELKPRLPLDVILKTDEYDSSTDGESISRYDEQVRRYYQNRSGGTKDISWSEQMSGMLSKEARPHMRRFLEDYGFMLK